MEKEALELVKRLNQESWTEKGLEHYYPFEFESNGQECLIRFMSVVLWDSENDERRYTNFITSVKEDLEGYIIIESKKVLNDLNNRLKFLNQ